MKCEICGFETDNGKVMSNHKRWKHIITKDSEKYKNYIEKASKSAKNKNDPNKNFYLTIICPVCGMEFETYCHIRKDNKIEYKKCCSVKCSNSIGSKFVDYSKVSNWQKQNPTGAASSKWRNEHPEFCNRKNHSKRELEIVKYFKDNFKEDSWQQGALPNVSKNNKIRGFKCLCPDLYSKKLKIIIEYDGIWHFKDIYNQLEHKQEMDRAIMEYAKIYNYRIIRIDEDLKLTNEQISDIVYNSNNQIELCGSTRYDYLFK